MKEKQKNNKNKRAPKGGDSVSRDSSTQPSEAVQAKPLEIKVYGNFEKAVRAFKALVQKEKILSQYKDAQVYEKPSDKKRRKTNEARRKRYESERKDRAGFAGDEEFSRKKRRKRKA